MGKQIDKTAKSLSQWAKEHSNWKKSPRSVQHSLSEKRNNSAHRPSAATSHWVEVCNAWPRCSFLWRKIMRMFCWNKVEFGLLPPFGDSWRQLLLNTNKTFPPSRRSHSAGGVLTNPSDTLPLSSMWNQGMPCEFQIIMVKNEARGMLMQQSRRQESVFSCVISSRQATPYPPISCLKGRKPDSA